MKLKNSFSQRRSLGQDVFEYLKNAIIDQTIEQGQRLVESKISDMLGISRTPLREALHKLEREDWIEKIPSGGYMVVTLTKDDIEHTFGIRSVLEAYAARLAAENHTNKELIPLEKKMKEYQKCLETKNSDKLQKINTEFHDLLYSLSGSPKLIKMINQLRAQISRFRQIILKQIAFAHKSNQDHIKMMDAIKKRDGDAVELLVRNHIIKGKTAVLSQLTKEEEEKKSA
ncbi:MAG: GntR family transcriptional regulator [Desulfobacula sp.]|nr:GntR family transcriptional regulator [Desulfobacula sp.]